jgi:hypothetical protein
MEVKSSVRNIQGECETYSDQGQTDSNIAPPSSASARTMSVSELRWKIFQLVDLEPSRKKTLLALALTCESFTGPALDLLWRELNGLGPLITCLPPTLWKLEKGELVSQTLAHIRQYANLLSTGISKGYDLGRLVYFLQIQPPCPFTRDGKMGLP